MARRLFKIASTISLVLSIASAALLILSYLRPVGPIRLPRSTATSYTELGLGVGYLSISHTQLLVPNMAAATAPFPGYPYGAELSERQFMGLRWRHEALTLQRPADRAVVLTLARLSSFGVWLGLPLLLTAILPACLLTQNRKLRRERQVGVCRVCGYDLRASKDRCPECGTPISAKVMT